MSFLVQFLLCVVVVEALSELIVKSGILSKPREFVKQQSEFVKELISCGYCTSVWVSIIPAIYLVTQVNINPLAAFLIIWFSLHRLANYLHNINDKHFDKFYSKDLGVKDG